MTDKAAGAAALKALRKRRGLSLAGLARALIPGAAELGLPSLPGVAAVQRSAARWEPAKPTLPDERYQLLLAPAAEAARRLLAGPVPEPPGAFSPDRSRSRPAPSRRTGPGAARRLLAGPVPEPLVARLRAVAVAGAVLAGGLAFETRDDSAARALYTEATREAGLLGQPWTRAGVRMSHALVALYSAPGLDSAMRLTDRAVRSARTGESTLIRARAHALQAELAARAGHDRQAAAALELAWYDMDADHAGDPAPTAFSAAHPRGFEGVCELCAGDPAAAHGRFARAAGALVTPRERVQRAVITADQALARVRLGEPRAAAGLLQDCAAAAAGTGGRVPALRLRQVRQEPRPWRREHWAADLDDHLMDMLGA